LIGDLHIAFRQILASPRLDLAAAESSTPVLFAEIDTLQGKRGLAYGL